MTSDDAVSSAVSSALRTNGHVLSAVARDPHELAKHLSGSSAVVVLADLDPEPRRILSGLDELTARFPAARFVALAGTLQPDLLMDAMQAGVRRVLLKQSVPSELQGVLDRIVPAESLAPAPAGEVITVIQASGGCGATTIAANVAAEITALHAPDAVEPTLAVDLDYCYGALAAYFGITPPYAIDHLLLQNRGLDVELLRSTATVHSPSLHLLASPASTQAYRPQNPDLTRLQQVIDLARRAYRHTVVDAPRHSAQVLASLASSSTHVLLVFQLCVKDVRLARAMLDFLDEQAAPRSHIVAVANRYARGSQITLDDASKVLGSDVTVRPVRNDFSAARAACNFGKPLLEVAPRSPFRRDLHELVGGLVPSTRTAK